MDIRTISFSVYFDADDETSSVKEGCPRSAQIVISGTEYQLQGFICFFFATYGLDGLDAPEMKTELMLKYHRPYLHEDEYRHNVNSLGHHYVLKHPDMNPEFSTKHLDHFVSGMEAVPNVIESDDGVSDQHPIFGGIQESWKSEFRYVDLRIDEKRDLFLDANNADPYENALSLEQVDTNGIDPMIVMTGFFENDELPQQEFIL